MLFNKDWDLKAGASAPAIIRDMRNRWFISDTHFFHEKFLTFEKPGGHKVRYQFSSVEEMNEIMLDRWNARVKPGDKVWHLGDVILGLTGKELESKGDAFLGRLHGRKDLIIGNHDKIKNKVLQKHFRKMEYWKHYSKDMWGFGFYLMHIPQRQDQMRKANIQVHGHIHDDIMPESNYINVCVEQTNFAPVHLEEILAEIRKRGIT